MFEITHDRLSRDYADMAKTLRGGDPRYEMVLKIDHRIQFTRFVYIQPVAHGSSTLTELETFQMLWSSERKWV